MLRFLFGWNGQQATFKPYKQHSGAKRQHLSEYSCQTLGLGDLRGAVRLPRGEDVNDWLATNTVDFYNELSIIWGIVCDNHGGPPRCGPGDGFPPGFEYRWAEGKTARKVSGPEYVDLVMTWTNDQLNDVSIFPPADGTPFPKTFLASVKQIYSRLFRLYAIIYSNYYMDVDTVGAVPHLNTSFKHFMYFVWEFDLVKEQEFGAIGELVDELKTKYLASPS